MFSRVVSDLEPLNTYISFFRSLTPAKQYRFNSLRTCLNTAGVLSTWEIGIPSLVQL